MAIEYVYALHDFEPQNDDEIDFVAGERIEVLEKDDAYGDGWWTVRLLILHAYMSGIDLFTRILIPSPQFLLHAIPATIRYKTPNRAVT
jgi:hypothetical protein